jgi:hypothetical protein
VQAKTLRFQQQQQYLPKRPNPRYGTKNNAPPTWPPVRLYGCSDYAQLYCNAEYLAVRINRRYAGRAGLTDR